MQLQHYLRGELHPRHAHQASQSTSKPDRPPAVIIRIINIQYNKCGCKAGVRSEFLTYRKAERVKVSVAIVVVDFLSFF